MTAEPKLSKPMKLLVAFMRDHDGIIARFPGGFWCAPGEFSRSQSFGTSSVEALVKRSVALYTNWQEGRGGRFPIEAQLTPEWRKAGKYA